MPLASLLDCLEEVTAPLKKGASFLFFSCSFGTCPLFVKLLDLDVRDGHDPPTSTARRNGLKSISSVTDKSD